MAKISLRVYNHEVEEMIAHNQFDQAIAHCRNILKLYPKHINTYRLLGKAFLESQRYGDAGDIFQRVLSSFPEDFISHVGMSIIREDEGNLDDALWHMERAFELQPSNNAVQGELRRLHGKREGVEPPKIRLTRGALAQMYVRGDLFPQAIAELRIALTEDSSRFDLQTNLAKAYHLSGQLAEAAKISNEIISKLPYSFEANRILAEIYKKSDHLQEAQPFLQRLYELDPYYAHLTENILTPEQVNDSEVALEKLEWQPGISMPEIAAQPEWATSIGISMESQSSQAKNLPDWLSGPEEETKKTDQEIQPMIEESEKGAETQPDWLSPETSPEAVREDLEASTESMPISDELSLPKEEISQEEIHEFTEGGSGLEVNADMQSSEISPAEIPEWLRSLAPDQSEKSVESAEGESPTPPEAEKEFSWLDESAPDQEALKKEAEEEIEPFIASAEGKEETPDWLQQPGVEPEIPQTEMAEAEKEEFLAEASTPSDSTEPFAAEEKDEFAWLSETDSGQTERESLEEGSVWIEESEEENLTQVTADEDIAPAVEAELPEWLSQMKQDMDKNVEEAKPTEEIPNWIKNIEEPPTTEEDTKPSRLLQKMRHEAIFPAGDQAPEISASEPSSIEETPLSSIFTEESFEFKEEAQEIDSSAFSEAGEEEAQLGWISELSTKKPLEAEPPQEEVAEIQPEKTEEYPVETQPTEAMQKEPGVIEEVQLPGWLSEVPLETGEEAEKSEEEKPDWLTQATPETTEESEKIPEEKPEWLGEFESKPPVFEETAEPGETTKSGIESPEIPFEESMMEEIAESTPLASIEENVSEGISQPSPEPLPDWLQEYNKEEAPAEEMVPSVPEEQPIPEVPAWFEQPEKLSTLDIPFSEQIPAEDLAPAEEIKSETGVVESAGEGEIQPEIPAIETGEEIQPEMQTTEIAEEPQAETPAEEAPEEVQPEIQGEEFPEAQIVPIDLNYASLVELERLPGIGFIKAQNIINFRNENGLFNSIDELINVAGFDEELIQELKLRLEVVLPAEELSEIAAETGEISPLMQARHDLEQGNISAALNQYLEMIYAKSDLNEIVEDLKNAIDRYPTETELWQTMGDACLRLGKLQDALNAYTEADKLIR